MELSDRPRTLPERRGVPGRPLRAGAGAGTELKRVVAAHNLERVGDRATNITERVIFMARGQTCELTPEPLGTPGLE